MVILTLLTNPVFNPRNIHLPLLQATTLTPIHASLTIRNHGQPSGPPWHSLNSSTSLLLQSAFLVMLLSSLFSVWLIYIHFSSSASSRSGPYFTNSVKIVSRLSEKKPYCCKGKRSLLSLRNRSAI